MKLTITLEDSPKGLNVLIEGLPNGVSDDDAGSSLACITTHQLCLYLRKLKDQTGLQLNHFTTRSPS